eukprot:6491021-Amphidinium_carterae.3
MRARASAPTKWGRGFGKFRYAYTLSRAGCAMPRKPVDADAHSTGVSVSPFRLNARAVLPDFFAQMCGGTDFDGTTVQDARFDSVTCTSLQGGEVLVSQVKHSPPSTRTRQISTYSAVLRSTIPRILVADAVFSTKK